MPHLDGDVQGKRCTKCGQVKALDQFRRDKQKRDGLGSWCRSCAVASVRASRALLSDEDRQKIRDQGRRWRETNPERTREHSRRWRREHPETSRTWEAGNREARQLYRQDGYRRYRAEVFAHYGEVCACCGTAKQLSIDHINGGGKAHRIELFGHPASSRDFYRWLITNQFPDGYQTLCLPCNRSKGTGVACKIRHRDRSAA